MLAMISLFDLTGYMVRPWAEAGYRCLCFDKQHPAGTPRIEHRGLGTIEFHHWDSDTSQSSYAVLTAVGESVPYFLLSTPPCTDLASSGSSRWNDKSATDPSFQIRAVERALCATAIANGLGGIAYAIENPVGALSKFWYKADYSFDPCDYGGYIPVEEAEHPQYPQYIPAFDAYKKRTLLWAGNGFIMPEKRPVTPIVIETGGRKLSPQMIALGGKSLHTKNVRSAAPRGFARAVFLYNRAIEPAAGE